MFGGGRGAMGGGSGMLRAVSRAASTTSPPSTTSPGGHVSNIQDPISSSSAAATSPRATRRLNSLYTHLSLSSSSSSSSSIGSPFGSCNNNNNNLPIFNCGGGGYCYWPSCFSEEEVEYDWVSVVDGGGFVDDHFVLGSVPSLDEVHSAVSALSQVFDAGDKFGCDVDRNVRDHEFNASGAMLQVAPVGAEVDWIDPSPFLRKPRALSPCIPNCVYDAFLLLQTEPSVQKMVISLSSDKAVWDAVLNNEVVRELRDIYTAPPTPDGKGETGDGSNPAMNIVKWICQNTKALIDRITMLVNDLFRTHVYGKTTTGGTDSFDDKLRTSFLLSIMVMLVVVVTRAHRA